MRLLYRVIFGLWITPVKQPGHIHLDPDGLEFDSRVKPKLYIVDVAIDYVLCPKSKQPPSV